MNFNFSLIPIMSNSDFTLWCHDQELSVTDLTLLFSVSQANIYRYMRDDHGSLPVPGPIRRMCEILKSSPPAKRHFLIKKLKTTEAIVNNESMPRLLNSLHLSTMESVCMVLQISERNYYRYRSKKGTAVRGPVKKLCQLLDLINVLQYEQQKS